MKLANFWIVAAATAAQVALAAPSITGVTARQRYPWNGKVDITYTVSGDIATAAEQQGGTPYLMVTATDGTSGRRYAATSLSGDRSLADGTHNIVWDMGAQGLALVSTNVIFSVSCEALLSIEDVPELVLCYDFDNELLPTYDVSGNGNNGNVMGASWHKDGYGNGYFYFDGLPGVRDQVDTTSADNHDFIRVGGDLADFPLTDFTISIVCCPQNGGTIIGTAQNEFWQREWDLTYNRFQWAWTPGHSSGAVGREILTLDFSGFLDSIQHFMVKRKGTRITVFRNGVEVARSEDFPNQAIPCYSYGLFLGNMELDSGGFHRWDCMKGNIYHAAIWKRALSEEEMAFLWQFVGDKYPIGETP